MAYDSGPWGCIFRKGMGLRSAAWHGRGTRELRRLRVMSDRWFFWGRAWIPLSAAFVVLFTANSGNGQTPARAAAQIPRMPDGKPNFTGLWQALGTADWDIRDHSTQPGPFLQLGATGAIPAGQGIVEGGEIPYTPAAAAKQKENFQNRMKLDPVIKCYMPGIPRAN